MNTYSEYRKEFTDIIASQLNGITVHSVHALSTQFEPELFNRNERVFNDAVALFKNFISAGKNLGAKFYTFHGPLQLKKLALKTDYDFICARLNEINALANQYGITISFENVHWAFSNNPEFFKEILKKCPDIRTTLDVKQALLSGFDPLDYLDVMQETISTIHICDIKEGNVTALPGKGEFDFCKFFKAVSKYRIDAAVLIENYSKDYETLDDIKAAYAYVKSLLEKAGLLK